MRPVLKPLTEKPLVFFQIGGDIIWRGDERCVAIAREQAEALREIYGDEADAAYVAGDRDAARHAADLWTQLTHAMDAQDKWKRLFNPRQEQA